MMQMEMAGRQQVALCGGGSNAEILIRQQQAQSFSFSKGAPQWEYVSPTPTLESRGLTAGKLRQIINDINDRASTELDTNFNSKHAILTLLPCGGLLVGFLLCVLSMGNMSAAGFPPEFYVGFIFIVISAFCGVAAFSRASRSYTRAIQSAVDAMKEYVDSTLNEEWQRQSGIRWVVANQQMLSIGNRRHNGNQRMRVRTLHHIEVHSLNHIVPNQVVIVPAPNHASLQCGAPPPYAPSVQS